MAPFYKYLDVDGARLTLRNRTLKHAKPSDFNDTEDLTIASLFPVPDVDALGAAKGILTQVLLANLHRAPTCHDQVMRVQTALIQEAYRRNPEAAKIVEAQLEQDRVDDLYDLDRIRRVAAETFLTLNRSLQDHRVLCVSESNSSFKMWRRYASCHKGIVLGLEGKREDSTFTLFRKVDYQEKRPPLYSSVFEFVEGSLFGDQVARIRAAIDKIIYTKTLEWSYEREYRLAIPIFDGEAWNTLKFHSDEIVELYLGAEIDQELESEVVALGREINPLMKFFRARHSALETISFHDI